MAIVYHQDSKEFHLYNNEISYIIGILPNEQLGQLYFGRRIEDRESFAYMREGGLRSLAAYVFEGDTEFSLQHTRQEYPSYGTTDFRYPAVVIQQDNGSRIVDFRYENHYIFNGKKQLEGLPATYVEDEREAQTLEIILRDILLDMRIILNYTLYENEPVITRSVKYIKDSGSPVVLKRAMSMSIDFPDYNFDMIQFSGAWGREAAENPQAGAGDSVDLQYERSQQRRTQSFFDFEKTGSVGGSGRGVWIQLCIQRELSGAGRGGYT